MQSAKEAREARRKRILESRSDRLAYITGDTSKQTSLKSSSTSPSQGASFADAQRSGTQGSAEKGRGGLDRSQVAEDSQEHVPDSQAAGVSAEPSDMRPFPVSSSRSVDEPGLTVSLASCIASTSSDRLQTSRAAKKSHTTYVKNIVQCIEVSEGLRVLAAVLVAAVVVIESFLSCCGHPWGYRLAAFFPRWPLILVFLTDLTLVIGAFVIQSQNRLSLKALDRSLQSEGLDANFDKISRALDVVGQFEGLLNLGLLCKKVAAAISLDCSIYGVTLVCGFSIGDYLLSCCQGY